MTSKKKLSAVFRRSEKAEQLKSKNNDSISSLRLVKSLALNYPLLHSWGFRLHSVIAIVTPRIGNVIETLGSKGSLVLGQTLPEIKKGLRTNGKTLFLFQYVPSVNSDERLDYLLSVVKSGMCWRSMQNRTVCSPSLLIR